MTALAFPSFAALVPRIALGFVLSMLGESVRPRTDVFGDPLPPGAIARLGTVRFRHVGWVEAIAFTPDGKAIIAAGGDSVRVWEAATGKPLRRFPYGESLYSSSLSTDGRRIALTRWYDAAHHVEVWDVASGKLLHKLGNRPSESICISPDGERIAALENTHTVFEDAKTPCRVEIWDATTGKRLHQWNGPKESIASMRFSADGKMLFLGGAKKMISIYDASSGKEIRCLRSLPGHVHELILSPRGDRIAFIEWLLGKDANSGQVARPGMRVFLIDTRTGTELRRWSVKEENGWIEKLAFAPDGKNLAASTLYGPIRIWNVADGKEVQYLADGRQYAGALAFAPDGQMLAVDEGARTIRLLNCSSGADRLPTKSPRYAVTALAIAADGRAAFTATEAGAIFRWNTRTGRELDRLKGHKESIIGLALARDARTLYSVSEDQTARVWNQATGKQRRLLDDSTYYHARLALSCDGDLLAVSCGEHDKEFVVIQTAGGKKLHTLKSDRFILALAFSSDARTVRALTEADKDLVVQSWETATGRPLPELRLPPDAKITAEPTDFGVHVALSPDGKRVAHSDADKVLRVIDVDTRRVVYRVTTLPSRISAVAFAPDGRTLAWAEQSGIIHWLEAARWSERRRLAGHTGAVAALAFSGDGRFLVSGSNDTTALVWNLLGSGPAILPVEQREACWTDLANKDAARAYRAMCRLSAAPAEAVALLRQHLKPVENANEKYIARWLVDLDADAFAVREKATAELRKAGELAEPKLLQALASRPSLEKKRRVQGLLDDIRQRPWCPTPKILRQLRAVEVLEGLGTPEARKLLESLAGGAAGARLTREARAVVNRLRLGTAP